MSRKFQYKTVPSTWLDINGRRLDCGPYMSGAIEAKEILKKHRTELLRELTAGHKGGIFNGPRFPRIYVDDPSEGVPFLGSTDILNADLTFLTLLSKKQVASNPELVLEEGWTLITCSGTIGRMAYARSEMKGMAGSQHFMRVVPDVKKIKSGYLYAYLSSRFGIPIVVSGTYGAIIQHIEPHHIADLPVPRLGDVEDQAHDFVKRAAHLRTEASELLKKAVESVKGELKAPEAPACSSVAQVVSSSEVVKSMRMDANFFNYQAREIEKWAASHKNGIWQLGDIADVYDVPPFKHIYVDSDNGVPFFTSGDLFKLERKAEKYISKMQTKDLQKYILGKSWVLLAISGQLGGIICRPQFSDSSLEGAATSDHVIRIVHKTDEVPPGYIYSYLATPEVGYQLIARTASGTSIPALWPTYLNSLLVVKAKPDFMMAVDSDVKIAFEMRVRATSLEDEARAIVERAIEQGGH